MQAVVKTAEFVDITIASGEFPDAPHVPIIAWGENNFADQIIIEIINKCSAFSSIYVIKCYI